MNNSEAIVAYIHITTEKSKYEIKESYFSNLE